MSADELLLLCLGVSALTILALIIAVELMYRAYIRISAARRARLGGEL